MDHKEVVSRLLSVLCDELSETMLPENYHGSVVRDIVSAGLHRASLNDDYTPFFIKNLNENSDYELELFIHNSNIIKDLRNTLQEETDENKQIVKNLNEVVGAVVGAVGAVYRPLSTIYSYAKQYEQLENKIGICRKLPTPEAVLRCQLGAYTRGINELRAQKSSCVKSRNPQRCAERVDRTVDKMEKSIESLRERLEQIAEQKRQAEAKEVESQVTENKGLTLKNTDKLLSSLLTEVSATPPKPYIPKTNNQGEFDPEEDEPEERELPPEDDYAPSMYQRAKSTVTSTAGNIRDNPKYAAKTAARYGVAAGVGVGSGIAVSRAMGKVVNPRTERAKKMIDAAFSITKNANATPEQLSTAMKYLNTAKSLSGKGLQLATGAAAGMAVGMVTARIAGALSKKVIDMMSKKRIDHCDRTFTGPERWTCRQRALDGSIAELKKMMAECKGEPKCVKAFNNKINQALAQKKEAADNYRKDRLRGK